MVRRCSGCNIKDLLVTIKTLNKGKITISKYVGEEKDGFMHRKRAIKFSDAQFLGSQFKGKVICGKIVEQGAL